MNDYFRKPLKEGDFVAFIDSYQKVLRKGRIKAFEGSILVLQRPNGDIEKRNRANVIKCPTGHT